LTNEAGQAAHAGRRLKPRLEGLTAAKSTSVDWRQRRRSVRIYLSNSIVPGVNPLI